MHGHDVRMVQARGRARLNLEAQSAVGLHAERRMQQLDRDGPVQPSVPAVAHLGHAAAAQNPPQFVPAAKNFWRLHGSNASATNRRTRRGFRGYHR